MKAPSITDRVVPVTATFTDEIFGHDHWRAAQFSPPVGDHQRPGVLLLCDNKTERDLRMTQLEDLPPLQPAPRPDIERRIGLILAAVRLFEDRAYSDVRVMDISDAVIIRGEAEALLRELRARENP